MVGCWIAVGMTIADRPYRDNYPETGFAESSTGSAFDPPRFGQADFSGVIPLYLCSGLNVIQDLGAVSRVA